MFKTIFSKLVVVYISILIIGFSIAGIMLYNFLSYFVTKDKVDTLNLSADRINSYMIHSYLENQNDPITIAHLEDILDAHSGMTNSFIWIVNSNGYIKDFGPKDPDTVAFLSKLKDESGGIRLNDERQYKEVMTKGQTVTKIGGDFYGLFKETGISWLTLERPLKYNGTVIGAVYFNTRIPEINRLRTSVFIRFLAAVAISVVFSIVLIYLISLRLSKPLKEINNAARVIAGGEFQKRLVISSSDEIGELADSFNHMVTALEHLEEMRRGFIANVSHELRTPMTSIRGFIEGILDGTIPPEKHSYYLTIVRDETQRLNRLVNDLLDLARMESGEVKLKFSEFDINELIRISIIKLEKLITEKDIQINADFEKDETYVSADMDSIERVIINLLHNAVKFTQSGGHINICTSKRKDKIYISIQDNGIGIDNEEVDLIWDRFHKSDKSRSEDKSGAGLGLAIVKNIINEHKQNIWVESEKGKGTKFTFTLSKRTNNENLED